MNSMTGFGRAEATNGDVTVVVEMKSVNNRFRDLNMRLPRGYLVLEPRIQKILTEQISRGRVDVFVRRSAVDGGQSITPDPALAERYLKAIQAVAKRLARPEAQIPLDYILAQPGVLTHAEADTDALSEWDLVRTAVEGARDDLLSMRADEGEALRVDLTRHLDQMQRHWAEVQSHATDIAERLRVRLQARITHLIGDKIDPGRLAQEAAVLADKADVSEELARLRSHTRQFADTLDTDGPIGRKLEFLVQELNREINTIGSKAAEHPISARVVDMKSVLERMREQAANVE